jgi:hypothetical protein
MAIFAHSNKQKPPWLDEAEEFCKNAKIKVMGWGPDLLVVEAKSNERAKEIASQLGQLGFHAIESEDDAYAGILSLSKNPAAVQAKIATFDISRRRWDEQIEPLIWALGTLLLLPWHYTGRESGLYWVRFPFGLLSACLLVWDGLRIWGWRLEILPEGLHVRRRFRWKTIPWDQIRSVESLSRGRQERVILNLVSNTSENLGTFIDAFARNLRDRLRIELAQRRGSQ